MSAPKQNSARNALLAQRAWNLRAQPTLSEAKLWSALSGSKLLGIAFRRQVVIGDAIVDFLAPSCRLIVEVDGAYHQLRERADSRRDKRLELVGYRVVRVKAELVIADLDAAVCEIVAAIGVRQG